MNTGHAKEILLNPEQKKAVDTTEGPLLIIAGAGAGKTKTITERIIALMASGVPGESILGITFTNKAAKEMRERVLARLGASTQHNFESPNYAMVQRVPLLTTFHALGVKILRDHAEIFKLPRQFCIFDKADGKRAVKAAMEKLGIDPKAHDPASFLHRISREKGEGRTLKAYKDLAKTKDYTEGIMLRVWEGYEEVLMREKGLDFDDLLLKTLVLFETHPEILRMYQERWKYIHVDEYQDTNRVQYLITKHLAAGHNNLCVVGDIDQNIYSWRGADIRNILNFEKDYPSASVVLLEENYRSTEVILGAANDIIIKNKHRREKRLFTQKNGGEKIKVYPAVDENDEASYIASTCFNLIRQGIEPKEIAVLFRANFQSRVIEDAFIKHGITYDIVGTRYFERKEVKDTLSYIRASLTGGEGDIKRIINVPTRGIGAQTEDKIVQSHVMDHLAEQDVTKAAQDCKKELEEKLDGTTKQKAEKFLSLMFEIKAVAKTKKPSELVRFVIEKSGLEEMYMSGKDEDEDKLGNIRELVTIATKYDLLEPEEGLLALLEEAALATDQDVLDRKEGVKLMTIHASKGLEFDTVFITGLEGDLFPHRRSSESRITPEEAEEERRLFYVALTRARHKLWLTHASLRTIYGERRVNIPSEFIYDINADRIEDIRNNVGIKSIFIDF